MLKKFIIAVAVISGVAYFYHTKDTTQQSKELNISGAFEFHGTDIAKDGAIFSQMGVTESLTGLDHNGNTFGVLAKDWSIDKSATEWTFNLRPNVTFHDGEVLSADAVVKSLVRAQSQPGVIKNVPIKSIEAHNDKVVITLQQPYAALDSVLAHYTLSIVSLSSIDNEGNMNHLYGTGPFNIAELIAPHKLMLSKYSNYWGEAAKVDKINYLAGHRSESRALLAQSGEADLAFSIDPISKQTLSTANNVSVLAGSLPRTILLKVNNTHPYLNSADVRKAISLSIDRKGIAESVLQVPGSEAYQLFGPMLGDWHLSKLQQTQNLKEAAELFMRSGWSKDSQGWLVRDGQRFALTLTTYANRAELPLIATALQNQLKKVGIELSINIDNSSAIPSGHHDQTLELGLIARNFGMAGSPLPLLVDDLSRPNGSEWGHMNWSSKQAKNLLSNISHNTGDINAEKQEVAGIYHNELPVIPIAYSQQMVAVNNRLTGVELDPYEMNFHLNKVAFKND